MAVSWKIVPDWRIAALAFCIACSGAEAPPFLELGQFDRDLVVFAALGRDDRIEASWVMDRSEQIQADTQISINSDQRLIGAAFDRAELIARGPRLDEGRLSSLSLQPASEALVGCPEGILDHAHDRTQIQWPEGTVAFEWLPEEERVVVVTLDTDWAARLSPTIAVRVDRCLSHPEVRAQPFAGVEPILQSGTLVNGEPAIVGPSALQDFVRLDDERVIAVYPRYAVYAQRGLGYMDVPGRNLVPNSGWRFEAIAAGPPSPGTGAQRLVLVSSSTSGTSSQITEAYVTGNQLTAGPVIQETAQVVDAVYVFPDTGLTIIYERPAQIYAAAEPGVVLVPVAELPDAQPETDKRGRLVPTGLAEFPVALVGSRRSSIYLGSADGRSWITINEGLAPGTNARGFASITLPEKSPQLFAGDSTGQVLVRRLADQSWTRLDVRVDPALIERMCAIVGEQPVCGFGRPQSAWRSFTGFVDDSGRPAVLGFPDLCSVSFVVGADGCASHFVIDELGPRTRDDDLVLARSEAGFVTLATELGRLFEVPWPALGIEP